VRNDDQKERREREREKIPPSDYFPIYLNSKESAYRDLRLVYPFFVCLIIFTWQRSSLSEGENMRPNSVDRWYHGQVRMGQKPQPKRVLQGEIFTSNLSIETTVSFFPGKFALWQQKKRDCLSVVHGGSFYSKMKIIKLGERTTTMGVEIKRWRNLLTSTEMKKFYGDKKRYFFSFTWYLFLFPI
jgi:hypothetical protein